MRFFGLPKCPSVEETHAHKRKSQLKAHNVVLKHVSQELKANILDAKRESVDIFGGRYATDNYHPCPYPLAIVKEIQKRGYKCDYRILTETYYESIAHKFTVSVEGVDFFLTEEKLIEENQHYAFDLPHLLDKPEPEPEPVVEEPVIFESDCELFTAYKEERKESRANRTTMKENFDGKRLVKSVGGVGTELWGLIKRCSNAVDDWIDSLFKGKKKDS